MTVGIEATFLQQSNTNQPRINWSVTDMLLTTVLDKVFYGELLDEDCTDFYKYVGHMLMYVCLFVCVSVYLTGYVLGRFYYSYYHSQAPAGAVILSYDEPEDSGDDEDMQLIDDDLDHVEIEEYEPIEGTTKPMSYWKLLCSDLSKEAVRTYGKLTSTNTWKQAAMELVMV